jgi:hypothetical protein
VVVKGERKGRRQGRTNPDPTLLVIHADMGGDLSKFGRIGVGVLVVDLAEDHDGFLEVEVKGRITGKISKEG